LGGVFQQVFAAQVERDVVEPAQRGLELLFGRDGAVGGGGAVAAGDGAGGVSRACRVNRVPPVAGPGAVPEVFLGALMLSVTLIRP